MIMPFPLAGETPYLHQPYVEDESGPTFTDQHGQQKRRKRQQQQQYMPPSNSWAAYNNQRREPLRPSSAAAEDGSMEQRGRRRRFHPEGVGVGGGSSDHGGGDGGGNSDHSNYSGHANNNTNNSYSRRRARIRKSMTSSNSSDGGNSAPYFNKKKKARQPNVDSLLGKTGISAIYEWCDKRRMTTPTFTLLHSEVPKSSNSDAPSDDEKRLPSEFDISVSIDGIEWGRGRARTKTAARQEAARRALQALIPGIVFDEATGILIELPTDGDSLSRGGERDVVPSPALWKASTSLEDLAPNLAKRLAIASKDDSHPASAHATEHSKKRPSKWQGVYPSTTTSEEDDENAYYASRGASVCSALLHAMVQIDDRIPEGPNYSYEIPSKADPSDTSNPKRPAGTGMASVGPRSPILVHRGPFTCTASMRLEQPKKDGETEPRYELLKAVGVGGAKREAKHSASAKLLALLFPECDGMAQVKEAAEATRERYAASKALKQEETKRVRQRTLRWTQQKEFSSSNILFALGSPNEPHIPRHLENHLFRGINIEGEPLYEESANQARRQSRHKQWDAKISAALQKLYEHDDEGRSLPEEELLTVDDVVGRTILRRATADDFHWISKLLDVDVPPTSPLSALGSHREISDEAADGFGSAAATLWSTSAIILLLCRAIAPYDDPPLGCAVLTLGFSMERGRTLLVSQIGSRPHLPRERFIECLQAFASCMKCALESETREYTHAAKKTPSEVRIGLTDIQQIIRSHLSDPDGEHVENESALNTPVGHGDHSEDESAPDVPADHERSLSRQRGAQKESLFVQVASPLQSVQEESEGVEESGAESGADKRVGRKKEQDKPSKRSRVH
jgi:hypothetical protein